MPRADRTTKTATPTAEPAKASARPTHVQRAPSRWPFAPPGFGPQAKLQVSQPNDPLEQEADRVAEAITTSAPTGDVASRPVQIARRSTPQGGLPLSREAGPDVESSIARATRSAGTPIPSAVRDTLEPRLDEDLSSVKLHADPDAAALADQLDARAFTVGEHVFFAPGQLDTSTAEGQRLLAHELTHVVQQRGAAQAAQPKLVQRKPAKNAKEASDTTTTETPPDPEVFVDKKKGTIEYKETGDGKKGRLILPTLKLPSVKVDGEQVIKGLAGLPGVPDARYLPLPKTPNEPYVYRGRTRRDPTSAAAEWRAALKDTPRGKKIAEAVGKHVAAAKAAEPEIDLKDKDGARVFYLGLGKPPVAKGKNKKRQAKKPTSPFILIGNEKLLPTHDAILLPIWNAGGKVDFFDADHIHELQLGGAEVYENLWLWDRSANRSSGPTIYNSIVRDIEALLAAPKGKSFYKGRPPGVETILKDWEIVFKMITPFRPKGDPDVGWTRDSIEAAEHIAHLYPLDSGELAGLGLEGGVKLTRFIAFPKKEGGFYEVIEKGLKEPIAAENPTFKGFAIEKVEFEEPAAAVEEDALAGTLRGTAFGKLGGRKSKSAPLAGIPEVTIPLRRSLQLGLGVYTDASQLRDALHDIRVAKLSPIQIDDAGMNEEGTLFLDGRIVTDKTIFKGLEVPIRIRGNEISVDFDIPMKAFSLGPLTVTDAAVRLLYGEKGFALGGSVGFEVKGVGVGQIEARGLDFNGWFELDVSFLDPARVEVAYDNETDSWKVDAKLKLKKGTLPGIESANVHVGWGPDGLFFEGDATLSIIGFKGTKLGVGWNKDTGLTIAADNIPLPITFLPGIKGGSAHVKIVRTPEGEWKVSGGGSAQIGIPALSGNLSVDVDGPLVTVAGALALEKGFVKGGATFVVTNKPLDAEGTPIDGPPREEYTAWGNGFAKIQFGKYLTGTVSVAFKPNGEWELVGDIALPPVVPIFDRVDWKKDLFKIPDIDIFLFGIPKVVDISLFFGAGVYFNAWIGPATIEGAHAQITFNPDRQEETSILGEAALRLPAYAGLTLYINGGLKGSIPVVKAKIGAQLDVTLGLEAAIDAPIAVEWTPIKGLTAKTSPKIKINPLLLFEGSIFAKVWLDLWLKNVWLVDEKWPIGNMRIPSSIALEATFPIGWSEESGLDFDVDDIQFEKPNISLTQIVSDFVDAMDFDF